MCTLDHLHPGHLGVALKNMVLGKTPDSLDQNVGGANLGSKHFKDASLHGLWLQNHRFATQKVHLYTC